MSAILFLFGNTALSLILSLSRLAFHLEIHAQNDDIHINKYCFNFK